jgi:hypothetical protein
MKNVLAGAQGPQGIQGLTGATGANGCHRFGWRARPCRSPGRCRSDGPTEFGGPCRDRTYDQLIKSQLLYQLS